MARRVPCLVFLITVVIPLALPAQQENLSNIFGQLRVVKGDFPAHPIMVELYFRGSPITSMYADSEGKFGFDNLIGGEYHIVINDPAYEPIDQRYVLHPDTSGYTLALLTLRPRQEQPKPDAIGDRASGSNPYLVNPADYNKSFPKRALKEYERGLDAERSGKPSAAIEHYLVALNIAPDYYPAHNNLGSLYLSKSDFKSAENQFREAVRLDQNEAQPYFNLSNVLMLTGRYLESQAALSLGLQRRPDSAFGNFLQGCLSNRNGKYAEAESSLKKALMTDPSMWQAPLQLVSVYMQQGRRDAAVGQLQAFLQLFPSAPAAGRARELLNRLQSEHPIAHPANNP